MKKIFGIALFTIMIFSCTRKQELRDVLVDTSSHAPCNAAPDSLKFGATVFPVTGSTCSGSSKFTMTGYCGSYSYTLTLGTSAPRLGIPLKVTSNHDPSADYAFLDFTLTAGGIGSSYGGTSGNVYMSLEDGVYHATICDAVASRYYLPGTMNVEGKIRCS